MNNYGFSGTEGCGGRALPITGQHCKAKAITGRRDKRPLAADPATESTLHGGQPDGAQIASAGRQLSAGERYAYEAAMDGPPDLITDYADRHGY